jgi:Protein of unknown function (DUF1573)
MLIKDIFTLTISSLALALSIYNFYVQRVRREDKLIGNLISTRHGDVDFRILAEYSICNIGDTQLVIKEVEVLCGGTVLESKVEQVPCVIKPGEIILINVFYNPNHIKDDKFVPLVEFGIFSAQGKAYRLPHYLISENEKNIWETFELKKEHEGF